MKCSDIGVAVSRDQFCDFLNSVRGGQFFHVRGYVNGDGEKADHVLRFGISYSNLKFRDEQFLGEVLRGHSTFDLPVTHGAWMPDEALANPAALVSDSINAVAVRLRFRSASGVDVDEVRMMDLTDGRIGNRKANGKTAVTLSYNLPSSHPIVIAAIGTPTTNETLLQGLVNPKKASVEYDKEAKSCYSLPQAEGQAVRWYIRDVLAVWKRVRVAGSYEFKASGVLVAVKDAIRRKFLLTGKYRQFILTDGQFEDVTIEGQAVLCDGVEEQFYFALPETVKAEAEAEAAIA